MLIGGGNQGQTTCSFGAQTHSRAPSGGADEVLPVGSAVWFSPCSLCPYRCLLATFPPSLSPALLS